MCLKPFRIKIKITMLPVLQYTFNNMRFTHGTYLDFCHDFVFIVLFIKLTFLKNI